MLCHRRDFAFKVPFPSSSRGICRRSAFPFAIERTLPSKCPSLRQRLAFAIKAPFPLPLTGIFLESQRSKYNASTCKAFAIKVPLPSKRLLPSKVLYFQSAFAIEGHSPLPSVHLLLPSKGLNLRSKGLCHRRDFAYKVPLPLAIEGPLPSKDLFLLPSTGLFLEANAPNIMPPHVKPLPPKCPCHRRSITLQSAFAFAIEGPF